MTNDHWVQIAIGLMNAIALVIAAVAAPVVASRINRPKQNQLIPKPQRMRSNIRVLIFPWVGPVVMIVVNLYALHLDMKPAPLTVQVVLHIAVHVFGIAIAFSAFIALLTLDFMADMLIETLDKLFPNFPPIKRDMGQPTEEQKQIPCGNDKQEEQATAETTSTADSSAALRNDKQEEQTTARAKCGDSSLRSE
jgi:hypothetical protein